MRLLFRIRLYLLNREVNALRKRALHWHKHGQKSEGLRRHLNRPHKQSVHMISWPVTRRPPAYDYRPGPLYVVFLVVVVAAVSLLNYFKD